MKRLSLVLIVAALAAGCATTGIDGRSHAPAGPGTSLAEASVFTAGAGAADVQQVRERTDAAAAQAKANGTRAMAIEPAARAGVDHQPEKANLTLKDRIAPMLKKGIPDGRDENTFAGGVAPAASDQKASNPKRKGAGGSAVDSLKKAVMTVELLMKRARGGEADEGFSGESIKRVKSAVSDATADDGKGRPNAQESLQKGIMKVHLLMKKGRGSVADEGFSGDSVRNVERQLGGAGKASDGSKESIREKVLQHTRRSVGKDCSGSMCRE